MCPHTRKIGISGRYGTRVGKRIREEVKKIYDIRKESECPNCNSKRVKRVSVGIWNCRKCGLEFTGGAYSLKPLKIEEEVEEAEEEEIFEEKTKEKTKNIS